MVGAYTSDSTPSATVYQILEVVLRAVPRQSLRARSKWLVAPGPSVAAVAALAGTIGTHTAAATVAAAKSTVAVLIFIWVGSLSGSEHNHDCHWLPVNILRAAGVVNVFQPTCATNGGLGDCATTGGFLASQSRAARRGKGRDL